MDAILFRESNAGQSTAEKALAVLDSICRGDDGDGGTKVLTKVNGYIHEFRFSKSVDLNMSRKSAMKVEVHEWRNAGSRLHRKKRRIGNLHTCPQSGYSGNFLSSFSLLPPSYRLH